MYTTEHDLVAELRSYIPTLWGQEAQSRIEVRCHDQARMDILIVTPDDLIAVEAKLSHWSRLLGQAFLHRYCVDYVYVAMPASAISEQRLLEAQQFGIGVVSVANGSTTIVQRGERATPTPQIRDRIVASYASRLDDQEVK